MTEKQLKAKGYEIVRGSYKNTTDDRLDRFYIQLIDSKIVDRTGGGFTTKKELLDYTENLLGGSEMGKFYIDYNTGVGNLQVNGNLDQAIEMSITNISYTGANVDIYNRNDYAKVAKLTWYGVEPTADDEPVVTIGDSGFYALTIY